MPVSPKWNGHNISSKVRLHELQVPTLYHFIVPSQKFEFKSTPLDLFVSLCFHSNVETYSEKEMTVSIFHTNDESNLTELLAEVALLKERNKSMEGELKEMRERYSEISLKFAEVEGERQQLVMTVRNLKNGKKS